MFLNNCVIPAASLLKLAAGGKAKFRGPAPFRPTGGSRADAAVPARGVAAAGRT